jgi:hypothetical protein
MKLEHQAAVLLAACALLAGRPAAAQMGGSIQPVRPPLVDPGSLSPIPGTPATPPDVPPFDSTVWKPRTGYGVAVTAGGGAGNYVGQFARDNTGVPGNWTLRASYGTRTYVGIEAAYLGAAGAISGLGLSGDSLLVRNGLETTLRLNAPLMVHRTLLEPYLFGGFGWDHYTVTNTPATSSVDATQDTLTTPFGAGFDVTYIGFVGDVRFAYRPTFEETLTPVHADNDLTNWTVTGQVGYEF